MIEFVQDPSYTRNVDELFPGRVRIIGLGQTGIAACDQLMLRGSLTRDLWVIDTDQQAVDGAIVSSKRLIGKATNHGLGCGGDRELAREIVAKEEMLLTEIVHGTDFLILIVGLAGATGFVLAESLVRLAHRMETKVLVIGVKPLPFEGKIREARCMEAIAVLRRDAHGVLVLSQDQLAVMPVAQRNIRYGFHCLHQLLATTAEAIAQIVCKRGLIQLSFADIRSLYGRYVGTEVQENFWLSYADDPSHEGLDMLVPKLLEGPILSDPGIWKSVDNAIAVISGPRNIALSDVQDLVVELHRSLPIKLPIATSACLESADSQPVRLILLLARTATVPVAQPAIIQTASQAPTTSLMPATARPVTNSPSDTVVMPRPELDKPSFMPAQAQFDSNAPTVAIPFVQPADYEPVLSPEELAELAELSALAESEGFLIDLPAPTTDFESPAAPMIQEPADVKPATGYAPQAPESASEMPPAPATQPIRPAVKSESPIQLHPQLRPSTGPVAPRVPLVFQKSGVAKVADGSTAGNETASTGISQPPTEPLPKPEESKAAPLQVTAKTQPISELVVPATQPGAQATAAPTAKSVAPAPASGTAKLPASEKASAPSPTPQTKETSRVTAPKVEAEPPKQPQPNTTARPTEIRRMNQQPATVPPAIQNPPPTAKVVPRPEPVINRPMEPKREPERKEVQATTQTNRPPKQEEIQFEPVARGRFEKAAQTFYRGEDLDQPAFRRRRLSIRL